MSLILANLSQSMLKPHRNQFINPSIRIPKPFIHSSRSHTHAFFPAQYRYQRIKVGFGCRRSGEGKIKAMAGNKETEESVKVKAVLTLNLPVVSLVEEGPVKRLLDDVTDWSGKTILLGLVSSLLDPETGLEKPIIQAYASKKGEEELDFNFEAEFEVPPDFGEVGAIFVENEHHREMDLKDVVLHGFPNGPVHFTCNSWIESKHFESELKKRVFFSNKSYLPSQTPDGLKRLRDKELETLRGNGQGERKKGERIYDYDVYNDLGQPDTSADLARPVLGGKEHPYPRRCRTGRPRSKKDPSSETRSGSFYVPRDEEFSDVKLATFSAKAVYSVLHALLPSLETILVDPNLPFPYFTAIDSLFNEGINLPPLMKQGFWKDLLANLVHDSQDITEGVLRFETPQTMMRDRFFWLRDEEFARQTLAGINPCSIQLITEWPLKSKLDPKIYGPPESAITTEMIEQEIRGFMTVEEALRNKKLFILDYHDLLLPFVSQVRKLKDTTLYGSRTVFFLLPDDTLRPVAIELTCPPLDGKPQWKQAFTPCWNATGVWLWRLAKAHVLAHDSGYHELVSHWLRTHCCTEPYIIATNRQLSAMHPIYRLLHPHCRYTMAINALARQALINADGIIESSFSPGKYSMLLSSVVYDKQWRFDHQALPNDLINRGMATPDPSAPHGLKLTIEDYPYANDGLMLWDIVKEWVSEYVNHYYPDQDLVASDEELQAWWSEIRNVGHGDKKDESWWPELKTPQDLIEIITTIVWTASAHHAAVNFGQYAYAGYFPNRPTIARTKMPTEDQNEEDWKFFLDKPEVALLTSFPSQVQAAKVMAVIEVLSDHSPDEEYLGDMTEPAWLEEPRVKGAFERFNGRLKQLEGIIDKKNAKVELKNRNGAGIVPYELLKPFSKPGVTGKGVPYSTSI